MTDLIPIAEAAARLGLSRDAVYRLCRRNRIGHYRLGVEGGRIMLALEDIDDYLASCRVERHGPRPQGKVKLKHIRAQAGSPLPRPPSTLTHQSSSNV